LTGGIDPRNFYFTPGTTYSYGIFTWSLYFKWGHQPGKVKNRPRLIDPYFFLKLVVMTMAWKFGVGKI
jgi:hypothetical protein